MNAVLELERKPESDSAEDYALVRRVIERLSLDFRDQPSLETLAHEVGETPASLQRLFRRWAGLSPKAFLQAVTLDHARQLLNNGVSLLDAAYESGLSGPGRLHDLFVTHQAMSPGQYKARGAGLTMQYGFHPSPFGQALIIVTAYGLAGLAFCDNGGERAALADMTGRWPNARFVENAAMTRAHAQRIFDPARWRPDQPLEIVMIGTDFQIEVWRVLLEIPMGSAFSYSEIARRVGQPKASRAVGAAIGANPLSFVVPCHRALGKAGSLTGYHWGMTRKRAMLGWEAGRISA